MATPTVRIPMGVAAVVFDLVESLSGPYSDEGYMLDLRRARMIAPVIAEAFEDAGFPIEDVQRPEIPLIRPGSKITP